MVNYSVFIFAISCTKLIMALVQYIVEKHNHKENKCKKKYCIDEVITIPISLQATVRDVLLLLQPEPGQAVWGDQQGPPQEETLHLGGQSGQPSRWRVFFQRGLPRLVFF